VSASVSVSIPSIAEYARQVAATAPELTQEQRDQIGAIIRGARVRKGGRDAS